MTLAGTRPPLISETNLYELHHRARLAIKPGITGMWQVFPFEKDIPYQVHILNGRKSFGNNKIGKGIRYAFSPYWIKKKLYSIKYKDSRAGLYAIGQFKAARISSKLKKKYDIAIGYLEGWSDEFVAYNVQAAQKIMWIHLDFANVEYINRALTEKYLSKADKIVCVSTECLKNFNALFPNLSTRSVYLPNINSSEYIKEKSLEILDDDNLKHVKNCRKFKIISVCRLSIYHKGIDRMFYRLNELLCYLCIPLVYTCRYQSLRKVRVTFSTKDVFGLLIIGSMIVLLLYWLIGGLPYVANFTW